jgi:hypothetical protein
MQAQRTVSIQEQPLACTFVPERQFYSVPQGKLGGNPPDVMRGL